MVQTTPQEHKLLTQIQELKDSMMAMASENAKLRVERDIARAQMRSLLPSATPEQEEEFRQQLEAGGLIDSEDVIHGVIAILENCDG